MSIQAIETTWKGYRFRSRMEARWAVFMDALNVPFAYEADAYALPDGTAYLPDFWLPQQEIFMEVKNPEAPSSEIDKISLFAVTSGKSVAVFNFRPQMPDVSEETACATIYIGDGEDKPYVWCECPKCQRTEVQWCGLADRNGCGCELTTGRTPGWDTPRLRRAYAFAAGYRFEPGASNLTF